MSRKFASGEIVLPGLHADPAPQGAGEWLTVLSNPDLRVTAGVSVGGDAIMNLHQDETAGSFRYPEFFKDGREFRIGRIVDDPLQPVDVDLWRDTDDCLLPPDDTIPNTEDDGAAATVSHADSVFDDLIESVVSAACDPFFEVKILTFEFVGWNDIEVVEEAANFVRGVHTWK
ncbi:hypothetical protein DSECCO2_323140 [anaerobic digester metagenome]|nr:hypothetical protein [Methanoculleus sp.]